jgi:hypothetical protein
MPAMMTVAPSPVARAARGLSPLFDRLVLAAAAVALLVYVAVALLRMSYPFDLEWLEGGMLAEVRRVLHSQPLYAAPSPGYVPFDYTPLYFLVAALPARVMGEGLAALRLTSFVASLGVLAFIALIVRREGGSAAAAGLAAGLFAATYRLSGAWLDLARPDALFLALVLAGLWACRSPAGGRPTVAGAAIAGALFALAFLTKQTALVIAIPAAIQIGLADRRRGFAFALTLVALVGASTLLLDRASGGWYRYYVFGVALGHGIDRSLALRFWRDDLLRPLAIAALVGASVFVRPDRVAAGGRGPLAALAAGMLGSAWWLRLYRGSYDNALLTSCAAVAILCALGWDALRAAGPAEDARARRGTGRLLGIALLAQFALLAYDPLAQLPTDADRAAGERLVANLRRAPGDVLVPCHPEITVLAGHAPHFHEVALTDVVSRGTGPVETGLAGELDEALRAHRWAAVVLDNRDWLWAEVNAGYRPAWPALESGATLWTRTGMLTRPDSVLVPR